MVRQRQDCQLLLGQALDPALVQVVAGLAAVRHGGHPLGDRDVTRVHETMSIVWAAQLRCTDRARVSWS